MCGDAQCATFKESTKSFRCESPEKWFEEIVKHECQVCADERKRRHRVLPAMDDSTNDAAVPEHLQAVLRSPGFAECLFITRYNEPVGAYALQRARLFAKAHHRQLLWTQAEDYLDDPYFASLSVADKIKRKKPWLTAHFHVRRTGGIPSLLPLCYDLPMRCMFANYGGA